MNKKEKILIIIMSILIVVFHEIGHAIGYKIDGLDVKFKFDAVIATGTSNTKYGLFGGTLINIVGILIPTILLYVKLGKPIILMIIGMISAISRLFACLVILLISIPYREIALTNDEGLIAASLGLPSYSVYFLIITFFLVMLWIMKKIIKDDDLYKNLIKKVIFYNSIIAIILIFV